MDYNVDNVMDMSLDEYIATKKNVGRNIGNNNSAGTVSKVLNGNVSEPEFKIERRMVKIDDNDDVLMNDGLESLVCRPLLKSNDKFKKPLGIWRGPSAETNYIDLDYIQDEFDEMLNEPELQKSSEDKQVTHQKKNNTKDLRDKLKGGSNANNNNIQKRNISKLHGNFGPFMNKGNNTNAIIKCSNVQTQPQSQSIPLSCNMDGSNGGIGNNSQFRRRWNNNRNFRRHNNEGCTNRGNGYGADRGRHWNFSNNRNFIGVCGGHMNNCSSNHSNNGRLQSFNQHYNEELLNKNIKRVLEQINSNNSIYLNRHGSSVRNLTIECQRTAMPASLATGALQTEEQPRTTQVQSDLKALLGVTDNNFKADTMAMWAGKLLDFIQSGERQTVHKPMYDMQIQKEIHELQGKSLLYKCPSGEVVSSDGSGIENCIISPSSSGVTLNYRFG